MTTRYLQAYDWPSYSDSLFPSTFLSSLFDYVPQPALRVSDDDKNYTLTLDVPGFKQDELTIEIDNRYLVVCAQNARRTYRQSIYLGREVDDQNVNAELKDGVLMVTLARKALPEPKRIAIKSGV